MTSTSDTHDTNTRPADICPPCNDNKHDDCMDDPFEGPRCACRDASHIDLEERVRNAGNLNG